MIQGLALGILIALQILAEKEIARVYNEYQFYTEDAYVALFHNFRAVLTTLQENGKKVLAGSIVDCIMTLLLIISFVINCCTIGKNLREKPKKTARKDNKTYGQIRENKLSE